ncbi:MAG: GTPase Era [Actinomycetota bacterium]|nr:GTPase Era [Actinomycetota bacterium]
MDEDDRKGFKSGFAGIIGRPNVGKSTLLNRLAGLKVAITSDKPQTTRNRIRAVVTADSYQLVFVDTPGFIKPKDELGERLNQLVRNTMMDVDVIVFLMDAAQIIERRDVYIAKELEKAKNPVVGVLNKVDLLDADTVSSQIEVAKHLCKRFVDVLPVSAMYGYNLDKLVAQLVEFLPSGPAYFDAGVVTDQPESLLVAELIREKALELTREEVPHSIAVMVEGIKPREGGEIIDVEATIYVERESQKGIVIGKGGRMIKEIGTKARAEIEPLLGNKVFLDLRVKVEKDWSKNPDFIRRLNMS